MARVEDIVMPVWTEFNGERYELGTFTIPLEAVINGEVVEVETTWTANFGAVD